MGADIDLKSVIDKGALKHNYKTLAGLTDARICVMAKADAYGHGLCETAKLLSAYGREINRPCLFGAATAEEALILRENGVADDILIVGGLQREYAAELIKNGVICAVLSAGDIEFLNNAAGKAGRAARAHLKLDTGMHRLGLSGAGDIRKAAEAFGDGKNVRLEGIFTHYATGDSNEIYLNYQYDVFNHLLAGVEKHTGRRVFARLIKHGAATGALLTDKKYHIDMVRAGLSVYGYGTGCNGNKAAFRPAMSVYTRIVQISRLAAGEFIGYGNNYRLERDTAVAVIRAGYGDGYKRGLSNRGRVSVKGRLCPVIGNVCMDLCMIDVTNIADIGYNDVVYLLNGQVTAEDAAADCGTISYDILTGFSRRINRAYI